MHFKHLLPFALHLEQFGSRDVDGDISEVFEIQLVGAI